MSAVAYAPFLISHKKYLIYYILLGFSLWSLIGKWLIRLNYFEKGLNHGMYSPSPDRTS